MAVDYSNIYRYGLIGYPLSHSFSPTYWGSRFAEMKLPHQYRSYPIPSIDQLPNLVAKEHLSGLNVTIPYKQEVIPYLHNIDKEAKAIAAVNCIKVTTEGKLVGYNTDAYGFRHSLLDLLDGYRPSRALVLGTGGAAAAVRYVLADMDITYTSVSRRRPYVNYDDLTTDMIARHTLIINTTPVGMAPHIQQAPRLYYDGISSNHYCYDLVYNPEKTLFLARSEDSGARIKNGYDMLILQAERSWEIWNK